MRHDADLLFFIKKVISWSKSDSQYLETWIFIYIIFYAKVLFSQSLDASFINEPGLFQAPS